MQSPPRPLNRPSRSDRLWLVGCIGALVGMVVGMCGFGLVALVAMWGQVSLQTIAPPDSTQPDITITVQEEFFTQMMAQSLPFGWGKDLKLDVQPGNRLVLSGRLKTTFLGQTLEADVSALITLNAQNGQLVVNVQEVNVSGFAVGGIGETFINDLSERISAIINEQVKAGLGQNAYIMSIATDDRQLVIRARWQ